MKIFNCFIILLLVELCIPTLVLAAESEGPIAIQVLLDDSGVLMESEQAYEQKLALLGHLRSMSRQRRFAQARIDVISTSRGRGVWIGTPLDLKGGPKTDALVQHSVSHPTHCNNLPAAFSELQMNIEHLEQQGFKNIYIIVFSSLIHTPSPCEPSMQITLPQLPPEAGIVEVLTSSDAIQSVAFYWVDHNQRRIWGEFLEPVSVHLGERQAKFGFFDIENTVYELSSGLLGISR